MTPPYRAGEQSQYARSNPGPAKDHRLAEMMEWCRQHLATATVPDLAAHLGVSARTLHRMLTRATGKSPQEWLTHERIHLAQVLLETTQTHT